MQRIMIIGGPGSGKSWLADALAAKLDLPAIAVDDHVWRPDRSLRPADEIDARLREAASAESWIIEGGNTRTYTDRLVRATLLIRLKPNRLLRLARILRRPPSLQLLAWTWRYDDVFGPKDDAILQAAAGNVAVHDLRSKAEVVRLLEGIGRS